MDKEQSVYKAVEEYFDEVSIEDIKPNSWKVPIGGGFYGAEEVNAVVKCYLHGSLSIQKPVIEFEKNFSNYIGVKYGVAVNSGTSANILALDTLIKSGKLSKGDHVVVPSTTFISVATPVLQLGLIPVYVDIEKETLNLDLEELKAAIKIYEPKCIMAVHTLGNPLDMDKLMSIVEGTDIQVIEDCCEAHGAEWNGKKIGSFGVMSTWSFYVAHHITTAEGGMILTNSDEFEITLRELREFGRDKSYQGERYGITSGNLVEFDERYTFDKVGWNFRMADAPASFGNEQLKKLDKMNEIRLKNAERLIDGLSKHDQISTFPHNTDIVKNSFYSFPIICEKDISRNDMARFLESKGIETRSIMCGTLPDQPALCNEPKIECGDLIESRIIRDNAFFVGCHPLLGNEEIDYIIDVINEYLGE
tara:strand:- start:71 stop:1327 length:1257 start_codon:yes stop_codon:yes gene_type:complete